MKQRIISGAIIALITLVAVIVGGYLFDAIVLFIGLWGSYEFVSSRNRKVNWVEYALMATFSLLVNLFFDKTIGFILGLIVALIALAVFDEQTNFEQISVTFIESLIIGFATHYMIEIENVSKWFFGYIVIIAYLTDVFALFVGMKFGKHKLNERISPKKTIEGAIGGWICGAIISFIYAYSLNFFYTEPAFIIVCSIVLPLVSEIGDLAFSLIKRHYGVKDFSNLIPGHGGLLDRLDSLMFVLLIYGALALIIGIY